MYQGQWGILYDQPIVLNRRQAGAAIEGSLRQRQVARIERVAVDTHGFTHFGMALAKVVGFDLCPHLAGLKKRKLYLPRGMEIPQVLRPIVAETVSRRAIARGWEGFLRLAPIGHKHINMRGILTFDLGRHRSSLLRQAPSAVLERAPG